jgi:hypothetical protein
MHSEHLDCDPNEQVTSDVVDELGALRVIADRAHYGSDLAEIVVLRVQLVGRTNHRSIGLPPVIDRTGQVGEGRTVEQAPIPPDRRVWSKLIESSSM